MATKPTSKINLSNNNLIIVALLITLIVIGITILVGKGLVTTIVQDTKLIDKKNTAKVQLDKNLEAAPKLVEAYDQLNGNKQTIADALPNTSDFPALIAQLENMSAATGVNIKTVSPDRSSGVAVATATGDKPQPQIYKFAVTMSGSYDSLQKMLTAIEHSVRPMKVNNIQIAGTGNTLTFSISLSTYFQSVATIPYKLEVLK